MATCGTAPPTRAVEPDLPGMDAALRCGPAGAPTGELVATLRCGLNTWVLAIGLVSGPQRSAVASAVRADALPAVAGTEFGVVAALRALDRRVRSGAGAGHTVSLAFALLELDRCGAWVSIGCGGAPLPVLVRRAGWIDVRGQRGPTLGGAREPDFAEDRVGLGPGDALVFANGAVTDARDAAGAAYAEERLPATLLAGAGQPAGALAERVLEGATAHAGRDLAADAMVLVVRVPGDAGEDPDRRLRDALGSWTDLHDLPGYPVGQPHWGAKGRPAPPRQARILLAPDASSVPVARRFTVAVLHSWRMSELVEGGDVELITSELVGNAVRHGDDAITVLVGYDGKRARVAVGDGSRELPRSRHAGEGDVSGRGLLIVEALAADFGVCPTVGGKRVWAEVDVSAPATGG